MKYLIEIDGVFYGYNNPSLARIQIRLAQQNNSVVGHILKKEENKIVTIYKPISAYNFNEEAIDD
jgi:hypothetical protein